MSSSLERSVQEPYAITGRYLNNVWDEVLDYLLREGKESAPRGKKIKEQLNVSLHVREPRGNILVNQVRNLGYRAMVAEWLWIASGTDKLAPLLQYNKNYERFTDDGITLYGAYGPRIRKVWHDRVELLQRDRDTRQAVISIWSPDTRMDTKDTPCTETLQFFIRQERLHLTVNMRSSDAWLGLPNDFYVFSQLQNEMGCELDLDLGGLTMNLGSSHLYEENYGAAEQAVERMSITLRSPLFRMTWPLNDLYRRFESKSGEPITRGDSIWNRYAEILTSKNREDTFWLMRKMERLEDE